MDPAPPPSSPDGPAACQSATISQPPGHLLPSRPQLLLTSEEAARKLWELDLVYFNWKEVSTHPDVPMDRNSVFVAAQERISGVEMFKIFGQVLDFVTMFDVF